MDLKWIACHLQAEALMKVTERLSQSVREARDACRGSAGLIEQLGIYDLENGMSSFRFLVVSPADKEPCLRFFDVNGVALDPETCLISSRLDPKDGGHAVSRVIAVELPTSTLGLFVAAPGAGFYRLRPLEHFRLLRSRTAKMCNPGIDGRYQVWIGKHEDQNSPQDLIELKLQPLMSVVTPVFNTPLRYLRELTDSLMGQTYPKWEHVLVNVSPENEELCAFLDQLDDKRFKVVTLNQNLGIPQNTLAGIKASTGDYISFVDHDDVIDSHALFEFVRVINNHPDVDLLYCDEDTLSEDGFVRSTPIFKPEFQDDLFTSWNYLLHMLTVSRRAYEKVIPSGDDVNGAQDYDLGLKIWSVMGRAARVPGILYHWRQHEGSVNGGAARAKPYVVDASVRAINRYYTHEDIDAMAHPHEILWLLKTDYARIEHACASIIINSHDDMPTRRLLDSLEGQRKSLILETHIVSNGNLDGAIRAAQGEYAILVDDAVTFDDAFDAIGRMVDALTARESLGIVSAKSQTPEGLNLHVGLCIKDDGTIGYLNQGFIQNMGGGYNGCAECQCDYSAVDLSCAAFRKADYCAAGGLSSEYQTQLAQAVDFSFRLRSLGKLLMVDPDARVVTLGGLEQLMLGYSHLSDSPDDMMRLWTSWGDVYRTDVLANPNYTLDNSYFNLRL